MSKLYISEYSAVGAFSAPAQIALEPSIATQVVDFASGEAKSAALNKKTKFVRLWADADCCVAFDDTATTSDLPMAASAPEFFGAAPGVKISAIALT